MKNLVEAELLYKRFMVAMGLDIQEPNAIDTPRRVVKYFEEYTKGLGDMDFQLKEFPNTHKYDQYVVMRNIQYYSICSHHHVPFFGKVAIVYFPRNKILGLSKFPRIVKHFSRKPQLQENLTKEISDFIQEKLEPKGIYVHITGRHLCVESRGIEAIEAETVTSEILGNIDKVEAMRLIGI